MHGPLNVKNFAVYYLTCVLQSFELHTWVTLRGLSYHPIYVIHILRLCIFNSSSYPSSIKCLISLFYNTSLLHTCMYADYQINFVYFFLQFYFENSFFACVGEQSNTA
jgi:hypothetical protein